MKTDYRHSIGYVRALVPVAAVAAGLSLYNFFIPMAPVGKALLDVGWFAGLDNLAIQLGGMPGDLPAYALTFLISTLFLGLFPLLAIKSAFPKCTLADLGLCAPKNGLFSWNKFLLAWLIVLILSALSSMDDTLPTLYPISKTLTVDNPGVFKFLIHSVFYILFFYIPWEFLFRGVLILPMLKLILNDPNRMEPRTMVLASLQVVPSVLLHYGHPIMETLGAIPFGILGAYMVIRYRSIWPIVILHASAGIMLDAVLTIKALQ